MWSLAQENLSVATAPAGPRLQHEERPRSFSSGLQERVPSALPVPAGLSSQDPARPTRLPRGFRVRRHPGFFYALLTKPQATVSVPRREGGRLTHNRPPH